MLIDKSKRTLSDLNLLPIGVLFYVIVSVFTSTLFNVIQLSGLIRTLNPYLFYWSLNVGMIILSITLAALLSRNIWKQIYSSVFDQKRTFFRFLILAIIILVLSSTILNFLRTLTVDINEGRGVLYDASYIEHINTYSSILGAIKTIGIVVGLSWIPSKIKNLDIEQ